jgi:hypothetical protein
MLLHKRDAVPRAAAVSSPAVRVYAQAARCTAGGCWMQVDVPALLLEFTPTEHRQPFRVVCHKR